MPAPIGGVFSLHWERRHSSFDSATYDPGLKEFHKQEKFIRKHLKCTVKFSKYVIPPGKEKLEGVMVLEATKEIEYRGIFVVMNGLPVDSTDKSRGQQYLSEVKFPVEGDMEGGGDILRMEEKSKETIPLEFDIPEELPLPWITPEGKLIFRMQAFVSTVEGRPVKVWEVPVRWIGVRVVGREVIDKQLVIEQQVSCRKTFCAMGKKKKCEMEWRVERGGYLAEEGILVELWGEALDKGGMEVECKVELVQKVWYQVPSRRSNGKMWVNLKVNILASSQSGKALEVDGDKKVVWMAKLRVPRGITPTQKFELINSVSYTIRGSVGVAGESKQHWEKGEVPLLIGTSKEGMEEGEGQDLEWDDDEALQPFSPTGSITHLHESSLLHRRGSGGTAYFKKSRSKTLPRVGSVSSMESPLCLAASILSVFKLTPSFSELTLRRLEVLDSLSSMCKQRSSSQTDPEPDENPSVSPLPSKQ